MITIIISIIIFPILVVIQIGVGVGIGAFLLLTIISVISSITLFRLYLIQTRIKNKTGVCIASTLNVTENLPATELENGETYKDLSNREFEITENDLNYSTVTSLKGTQCSDKFSPVHNERKKKSYASDNRDCSATVMKKTFTNAASNYEEIDLTPCDVSVQKETQMQKGPETWDPSHIYSAVNKKSTKTAVKKTAVKPTNDNSLIYAVVDKKKPKVPPRSNVTDYILDSTAFEQEEEAPEIPPFDLSMMYPVD